MVNLVGEYMLCLFYVCSMFCLSMMCMILCNVMGDDAIVLALLSHISSIDDYRMIMGVAG